MFVLLLPFRACFFSALSSHSPSCCQFASPSSCCLLVLLLLVHLHPLWCSSSQTSCFRFSMSVDCEPFVSTLPCLLTSLGFLVCPVVLYWSSSSQTRSQLPVWMSTCSTFALSCDFILEYELSGSLLCSAQALAGCPLFALPSS